MKRIGLLTVILLALAALAALATVPAQAAPGQVLILADTVSGGMSSKEALRVSALGKTPVIVTQAQWSAMTAAQFASYDGIILGDPTCSTNVGLVAAAVANANVWGPVIDGNVIIIGSDPIYHWSSRPGAQKLVNQGIDFSLAEAGKTGAYIDLSCYYHFAAANTPVPLLNGLNGGGFTVIGGSYMPGLNDVRIVAAHPALAGLTNADLSNWGNSVHEAFTQTWPAQFEVLAVAADPSGSYTSPDGRVRGYPYILARGEDVVVLSDISLAPASATNPVGTSHTLTATVEENDVPQVGKTVTFRVLSGPHTGYTGTGVTNGSGVATWSYTGMLTGQDVIRATFVDSLGRTQTSGAVTKDWTQQTNLPPTAEAGGPYSVPEGGSVVLNGSGNDPEGGPLTYAWDLDNNGSFETPGQAVTFSAAGLDGPSSKTVVLQVCDDKNACATDTAVVNILNVAPTVDAGPDATIDEGSVFASSGSFTDPGADTWIATVDYGDGSGSQPLALNADKSFSLSHVYADNGVYTVTVTVTDDDGGVGSDTAVVTVNDLGPTAAFTWMPEPQDEGSAVQFTDGSTSYPDAIVGWAWDFGDGGVSSDQNPAHTYADNGIYTVTLTVTDDDGSTDIATHTVTVQNVSPSVDAGADATINEGDTFSSAGSFTDPGADSWTATVDYGDGSGSQPLALSGKTFGLAHVYDDNGAYTVTVTVTDDDGGVGSDTAVVTVLNVAPTADAGADKAEYWGLSIAFSGSATDPSQADTAAGLNPEWAFGDGGTASGYDVSHIYANPGAYTATLTVTDKDGGSDTDDAAVTVKKRATGIAYTGDTAAIFGYAATLKAQLSDSVEAASALLAGRSVTFTINGVVIAATTDASGVAQATAPSLLMPGTYAVAVAFAGDSHYLGSSATGTLTVGNSVGKVTGGSMKFGAKGRGGFNVQSDGLTVKGELQYQDNSTNFHAPQLTALGIAPDRKSAWFAGVGRDGRSFVAYVEDNGEPGSKDVFKLWINGVAYNGDGVISGGNIQIHK